jgi:hypothetical protein
MAAAWHIDNKNVSIALIPLRDSAQNRCVVDAAAVDARTHRVRPPVPLRLGLASAE